METETNYLYHMDILQVPTPEQEIYAKIGKWIASAKPDKNRIANVVFKKDTPKKILELYEKNLNLIPFPVHKAYTVEK